MLPITRATINNFCRACLQDLDKSKTTELQHNLKEGLQLLRIVELLAEGRQPMATIMNLAMPTRLCFNCYTKIGTFCKFAEMSICSRIALNEITDEHHYITENTKFKMICETCFKIKSDNCTSTPEIQNLMQLIFTGFDDKQSAAKSICKHCTLKCKTFLDFQKTLQESQQYLKSTTMSKAIDMIGLDVTLSKNKHPSIENDTEGNKDNIGHLLTRERELDISDIGSDSVIDHIIINSSKALNQCPYCQREFKRKTHLNDHVRLVHEGLRPHKCNFCERSFGLPSTLRIHIMGHTKERPFKCKLCEKSFRRKSELNLHMNNHLSNSQFRCLICSNGRASQEDLESHMSRHNNKEGYQCSTCGRKFKKLCHLKEHDDAVHLKLRPFICTHNNCGQAFGARKTLYTHQKTHTRA